MTIVDLIPTLIALGVWATLLRRLVPLSARWRRSQRGRAEHWWQAAHDAGLSSIEVFPSAVTGQSDKLLVRIRASEDELGRRGTQLEIQGPGLVLTLMPRRAPSAAFFGDPNPKEIETGDSDFDRDVAVLGVPEVALAVLDLATRSSVRSLVQGRLSCPELTDPLAGELNHGVLRFRVRDSDPSVYGLKAVVRSAVALAERLVAPKELASRLAANLKTESVAGVRRMTCATLLREFRSHTATREALRSLREDADPEMRLRAGIALEADGRDTLLRLARGEASDDATSSRAIAALGGSLMVETAIELLDTAVLGKRPLSARACVDVLGGHGAPAVPALVHVLAVSALVSVLEADAPALVRAAVDALGQTGDVSAEVPLLRVLAGDVPDLAVAAATALGRVGSRTAVAPLREAEGRGFPIKSAARQAIAQIQSRLGSAERGQLSLASGEAGQLTIVDDETGRLSLGDERDSAGS